jgi:hypothetical protein
VEIHRRLQRPQKRARSTPVGHAAPVSQGSSSCKRWPARRDSGWLEITQDRMNAADASLIISGSTSTSNAPAASPPWRDHAHGSHAVLVSELRRQVFEFEDPTGRRELRTNRVRFRPRCWPVPVYAGASRCSP